MRILQKLFLLLGSISALLLAVTAGIFLNQFSSLHRRLSDQSAATGERTIKAGQESLYHLAKRDYRHITREKAGQLEAQFESIRESVLLEARLAHQALDESAPTSPPLILEGNDAAAKLSNATGEFATKIYSSKPYVVYHLAPGVPEEPSLDAVRRLSRLAVYFYHNQRSLQWCRSSYVGHSLGFILGYPGRTSFPADFDPRKRPWYVEAAAKGHLIWTGLYSDRNEKTLLLTCACPIHKPDGSVLAVAAMDINLESILKQLFDMHTLPVTDAILVDSNGRVQVSAAYGKGAEEGVLSAKLLKPDRVVEFQGGRFGKVYETMLAQPQWPQGVVEDPSGDSLYAYAKVRVGLEGLDSATWTYMVRAPVSNLTKPVQEIKDILESLNSGLAKEIDSDIRALWGKVLLILGLILTVALLMAYLAARSWTKPLVEMAETVQKIGRGDLDQRIEVRLKDEIGEVARAINEMAKGLKEGLFVKETFKRYVAASVVDQLLKEPDRLKLGGEAREMTVFFSDIAGFTSLAEKLKPEELVEMVNEYLGEMTERIFAHQGTLDKYVGDAIVAFWGAPVQQPDHAERACRAALDNLKALRELEEKFRRRGLPPLEVRIGLNTGRMVVGNMGSSIRMEYTVMGDMVNLGSRLEGANKAYGTHILMSEATRLAAGEAVAARELDTLAVKGKATAVRVYELLGLKGEVPPARMAGYLAFEKGLAAYRSRDWGKAEDGFRAAVAALGQDPPSEVLLERTAAYRKKPPEKGWDGTFTLLEK